jgi:hypothetical protein
MFFSPAVSKLDEVVGQGTEQRKPRHAAASDIMADRAEHARRRRTHTCGGLAHQSIARARRILVRPAASNPSSASWYR